MSKTYAIHVCSFEAVEVKSRTTYAELRAMALEAGRFSVFEATATPKAARLFSRLCADPEIETKPLAFPWTSVKRKDDPTP